MELVKAPVPVPSLVLVARATVGPVVVLQQTPRAVTALPPSAETFPPLVAAVAVIAEAAVVVRVGVVVVVKVISLPYAVPTLLVA
jgi:hypothetical protein